MYKYFEDVLLESPLAGTRSGAQ